MTEFEYASKGIAVDQMVSIGTPKPIKTTVRSIEMFDRGMIYGEIDREGETWIVRLTRPGCWRIVGPKDRLEAEVQALRQTCNRPKTTHEVTMSATKEPTQRRARARLQRHIPGQMNTTEKRFLDEVVLPRIASGELHAWWFESLSRIEIKPWTLNLAERTRYTMDFLVQLPDGSLECWEVKGGYWQDDARVKAKVTARMFPFPVVGWMPRAKRDGGGWTREKQHTR
jgi:hypothetical protein